MSRNISTGGVHKFTTRNRFHCRNKFHVGTLEQVLWKKQVGGQEQQLSG